MQNYEIIKAMESDSGLKLRQLKVDGGAAANDLLMQIQADLIHRDIVRPRLIETTAMGAAFLAGLAIGYWPDVEAIARAWKEDRTFSARMDADVRKDLIRRWNVAVGKA